MIFAAYAHAIRSKTAEVRRMAWRLSPRQKRKYEAVERLGLTSRLLENGWPGLTAKESGRVGATLRHAPQKQE